MAPTTNGALPQALILIFLHDIAYSNIANHSEHTICVYDARTPARRGPLGLCGIYACMATIIVTYIILLDDVKHTEGHGGRYDKPYFIAWFNHSWLTLCLIPALLMFPQLPGGAQHTPEDATLTTLPGPTATP